MLFATDIYCGSSPPNDMILATNLSSGHPGVVGEINILSAFMNYHHKNGNSNKNNNDTLQKSNVASWEIELNVGLVRKSSTRFSTATFDYQKDR